MTYHRRPTQRRNSRGRAPKRSTTWVRTSQLGPVGAPAPPRTLDLLPDVVIDTGSVVGSTVTRIRGTVLLSFNASPVANANAALYIGVCILNRDDITVQTVDVNADKNNIPWMHYDIVPIALMPHSVSAAAAGEAYAHRIDVKSQRRILAPNESLALCLQPANGEDLGQISAFTSTLLKLS